jgi:drug/metabolite transporter (DMT)-like permease
MNDHGRPSRVKLVAAFLAVYVIWGSTYLAIRVAIESIPPFLMAGARFLIAGSLLVAWARWRGNQMPTLRELRSAAIVGVLLLMGGNGAVVWSEQRVPSGIVALLVATVPLWMVLLAWGWKGAARPTWRIWTGIGLGLVGVAVLVGPEALGAGRVDALGAATVLFGSLSWATGSIYSRTAELPRSPIVATGFEMLAGGLVLTFFGLIVGEGADLRVAMVTGESVGAVAYLVIFGSFLGFTAYIWLLRTVSPASVATYAYVNPVVAVALGWAVVGEPLSGRTIGSAIVVLTAVALISSKRATSSPSDTSKPARNRPSGFGVARPRTSEGGTY